MKSVKKIIKIGYFAALLSVFIGGLGFGLGKTNFPQEVITYGFLFFILALFLDLLLLKR